MLNMKIFFDKCKLSYTTFDLMSNYLFSKKKKKKKKGE